MYIHSVSEALEEKDVAMLILPYITEVKTKNMLVFLVNN